MHYIAQPIEILWIRNYMLGTNFRRIRGDQLTTSTILKILTNLKFLYDCMQNLNKSTKSYIDMKCNFVSIYEYEYLKRQKS